MKPSPALLKRSRTRLPYNTKDVGSGFYKGTGTGSLGAHTIYGGYLIDYRKVREYVPPESFTRDGLKDFHLTPFVSAEIERPDKKQRQAAAMRDGLAFLRVWRDHSPAEYDDRLQFEQERRQQQQQQQQRQRETSEDGNSTR